MDEMALSRDALIGAAAIIVASAIAPARAELSCRDFTRGYILQDSDVLGEAREIAQPWFDAASALMTKSGNPNKLLDLVHLEQLSNECSALPTDSVDRIVATHLKNARQQLAAMAAKKAAEPSAPPPALSMTSPDSSAPRKIGNDTGSLSADQRGAIADHTRECYSSRSSALDIDKQHVLLKATTAANGVVRKAEVAGDDIERMADPRFRAFANRSMAALLDPRCANLPLPNNVAGKINVLTFQFTN